MTGILVTVALTNNLGALKQLCNQWFRRLTDSRNLASGVICAEFKILNKTIIWSFYLELKRANSIPSTVNLEGEEKTRGVTLQKNRFFFRYYLSKMDE